MAARQVHWIMTDGTIQKEIKVSVECEWCEEPYWGDGSHECDEELLRSRIDSLKEEQEILRQMVKDETEIVNQQDKTILGLKEDVIAFRLDRDAVADQRDSAQAEAKSLMIRLDDCNNSSY